MKIKITEVVRKSLNPDPMFAYQGYSGEIELKELELTPEQFSLVEELCINCPGCGGWHPKSGVLATIQAQVATGKKWVPVLLRDPSSINRGINTGMGYVRYGTDRPW